MAVDLAAADIIIGIWAAIWLGVAGLIAFRGRHGDRPKSAGWLILVAALLAGMEDPSLLIWMASISPSIDRDGVAGLVHPHVIGHMYGGAVFALAALVLSAWVARTALRNGAAWAWWALLVVLLMGATADIAELLLIYPHGLPFGANPPDGVRGFGWQPVVAWILIWAFALWYCRRQVTWGSSPEHPPDAGRLPN
jgi:hypothetical protein